MSILDDLAATVAASAADHFDFCDNHGYDCDDPDPRAQLCRSTYVVEFPETTGHDEVRKLSVELSGSQVDVDFGIPTPLATIAYNDRQGDFEMEPWKLRPIGLTLLAAEARARGDLGEARAYMDAAHVAIVQHFTEIEDEQAEPEYVVSQPERSGFDGPFDYVMVGNGEDGFITYDQYEVEQSLAAGIPQWVIQHAEDGHRYVVVGALDSKPVDGETYGEFADAKTVRDRLNGQARAKAKAPRFTVVEADCGHYRISSGSAFADDVHYASRDAAQAEAAKLEALGAAA